MWKLEKSMYQLFATDLSPNSRRSLATGSSGKNRKRPLVLKMTKILKTTICPTMNHQAMLQGSIAVAKTNHKDVIPNLSTRSLQESAGAMKFMNEIIAVAGSEFTLRQ